MMIKNKFQSIVLLISLLVGINLLSSCEKEDNGISKASSNPQPSAISPELGAAGEVITLTGKGIGGIKRITFSSDSVNAVLNTNFNIDGAVIFRVPNDAIPGTQEIVFENTEGVIFKVPFKVLGLPNILNVSNYNFKEGQEITLTGKNLADVESVKFQQNESLSIQIVSKTLTSLVIKMPKVTDMAYSKLIITNEAGTQLTTQEFLSLESSKILKIFLDDLENGYSTNFWGKGEITTSVFKSGTSSVKLEYPQGWWSANGFADWGNGGIDASEAKYLSFWIKGGAATRTYYLTASTKSAGYGNSDKTVPLEVLANEWNYFRLKIADIDLLKTGNKIQNIGIWINGPDDGDGIIYVDDFILVK